MTSKRTIQEIESILERAERAINGINNLRARSEQKQDSPFDIRIPNEETRKTIDKAEKGIDLIECDDADDLFRKLGISKNSQTMLYGGSK